MSWTEELINNFEKHDEVVFISTGYSMKKGLAPSMFSSLVNDLVDYLHKEGKRVFPMDTVALQYLIQDDCFPKDYFKNIDLLILENAEYLITHQSLIPVIRDLLPDNGKLLLITTVPFNIDDSMNREFTDAGVINTVDTVPYHDLDYTSGWMYVRRQLFCMNHEPVSKYAKRILMSNFPFTKGMDLSFASQIMAEASEIESLLAKHSIRFLTFYTMKNAIEFSRCYALVQDELPKEVEQAISQLKSYHAILPEPYLEKYQYPDYCWYVYAAEYDDIDKLDTNVPGFRQVPDDYLQLLQ